MNFTASLEFTKLKQTLSRLAAHCERHHMPSSRHRISLLSCATLRTFVPFYPLLRREDFENVGLPDKTPSAIDLVVTLGRQYGLGIEL